MTFEELTPLQQTILAVTNSLEPKGFGQFCRDLGPYCPEPKDSAKWRDLFVAIDHLRAQQLIVVKYLPPDTGTHFPKIQDVQLTVLGAALVGAKLDESRGLFGGLE